MSCVYIRDQQAKVWWERGEARVAAYLDEMVSGDFLLLFHCVSSIYSLHAFQKPSVPLWSCLWARKERPHLTSISTGVLKTHRCNFINHYNSGEKSQVELFRNNSRLLIWLLKKGEPWSIKDQYPRKNRAGSRKWAKVGRGRALTKAASHTHTHSDTIKYSPRQHTNCVSHCFKTVLVYRARKYIYIYEIKCPMSSHWYFLFKFKITEFFFLELFYLHSYLLSLIVRILVPKDTGNNRLRI